MAPDFPLPGDEPASLGLDPARLEDLDAMIRGHHGYNNGISHYIEARESYDRLLTDVLGAAPSEIVFTGVGKSGQELARAVPLGLKAWFAGIGIDRVVADVQTQPSTFIGDYHGLGASGNGVGNVLGMWFDSRNSSALPPRPHLRVERVIALACKRSPLATSTPERDGNGVPLPIAQQNLDQIHIKARPRQRIVLPF